MRIIDISHNQHRIDNEPRFKSPLEKVLHNLVFDYILNKVLSSKAYV